MKIVSVEAILLSFPLPEPVKLTYYGGERIIMKRDAMLIRVKTDKGITGFAPGQGSERAERAIRGIIAPWLAGKPCTDPDALRVAFDMRADVDEHTRKMYRAVEVALYDALGKARGVPVSEMLGGRVRDRIRLYGSAGMYQPPEAYAEEAHCIQQMGFTGYKMRPALGPAEDLRTVELMRQACGPAMDLMVDAHSWWRMGDRSYTPQQVSDLADGMAEFDICWLEEPMPPLQHELYRVLFARHVVPVASGEHEQDDAGFMDLIATECVNYAQMDIVCQGGYPLARRIFDACEHYGVKFAFHSWGTNLEVMAAAHVGICWPDTTVAWLEQPIHSRGTRKTMYPFDLAEDILKSPLPIENGDLVVPRAPGLGVEVDETVIDRYPWIPGPWSTFTLISPPGRFVVTSDHSVQWAGEVDA
jgi:L-alanine-DL-glutamate epimerase-like enolase superfamily enzyme